MSDCAADDDVLRLTCLRYAVLAALFSWRIFKIKQSSKETTGLFYAAWLFAQSEGIGLMIYFGSSAVMDNYSIYLAGKNGFCEYIKQIALYSMALVTFLPTCLVPFYLQRSWFDQDDSFGWKIAFVFAMVFVSVASFLLRLELVYVAGWADFVEYALEGSSHKVIYAVLTPPLVDALQTLLLIASSLRAQHSPETEEENASDIETSLCANAGSASQDICLQSSPGASPIE